MARVGSGRKLRPVDPRNEKEAHRLQDVLYELLAPSTAPKFYVLFIKLCACCFDSCLVSTSVLSLVYLPILCHDCSHLGETCFPEKCSFYVVFSLVHDLIFFMDCLRLSVSAYILTPTCIADCIYRTALNKYLADLMHFILLHLTITFTVLIFSARF